jgi:hypothetical protein
MEQKGEVVIQKIVIFENCEYADIRNETKYQEQFPSPALFFLNKYPCKIIDHYRKSQDQYVNGDKCHIEIAAANKEQKPSLFIWDCKV